MESSNEISVPVKSEASSPSDPNDYPTHLHRQPTDTIAEAAAAVADEALEDEADVTRILATDEASALFGLTENVRDQDDLERDITNQANLVMIEQEDERDQKRIDKVQASIEKLLGQKRLQRRRHDNNENNPLMQNRCRDEIRRIDADITALKRDLTDIQSRIAERHQYDGVENGEAIAAGGNKRMPNESQRDFLIRTGKITPFSRMPGRGAEGLNGDLTEVLMDAEEEADQEGEQIQDEAEPRSHQNLRLPGFADASESGISTPENEFSLRPRKKRKLEGGSSSSTSRFQTPDEEAFTPELSSGDVDEFEDENDELMTSRTSKKSATGKAKAVEGKVDLTGIDDGMVLVFFPQCLRKFLRLG